MRKRTPVGFIAICISRPNFSLFSIRNKIHKKIFKSELYFYIVVKFCNIKSLNNRFPELFRSTKIIIKHLNEISLIIFIISSHRKTNGAGIETEHHISDRIDFVCKPMRPSGMVNFLYVSIIIVSKVVSQIVTESIHRKISFDELIKGEYKQDFDARVQNILRERFRKNDEASARMQPLFQALGKKYNVDASDLDALTKAIDGDDSLYEQEAMERGMSVESLKAIKQIERENAVLRKREETNQQEMQIRQHLDGLARQGEELKKLYPGFDLQTELRNPEFLRLTSPGVNVSVRTAYEVVHRDEMRGAEMQFAAQKSAERLSNSIRSNSRRPSESGLGSGQERGEVKTDPRTLSKADRAEIKRRVARGEKIVF